MLLSGHDFSLASQQSDSLFCFQKRVLKTFFLLKKRVAHPLETTQKMKVGTRKEWLTGRGEGGELRTASATPDPLLQSEIDEQVCLPVHSREASPSWVVFLQAIGME